MNRKEWLKCIGVALAVISINLAMLAAGTYIAVTIWKAVTR